MFPVVPYDTDEDHNKKDQSSYKKRTHVSFNSTRVRFSWILPQSAGTAQEETPDA